jgi:TM2 domain-containing membrane protein YozV
MYCRNCGKEVDQKAVACPSCGVPPRIEKNYCFNCGQPTISSQVMCTKCGVSLTIAGSSGDKSKIAAGLLGIFLGVFGIHKFYLGYTKEGVTMLLISVLGGMLTFGIAAWVIALFGLIEGIIYLTKSDEEFSERYVQSKKAWF